MLDVKLMLVVAVPATVAALQSIPIVNYEYAGIGFLGWAFGSLIKGKSKLDIAPWRIHVAGGLLAAFLVLYGIGSIEEAIQGTFLAGTEGWILFFLTANGSPWVRAILDSLPEILTDKLKSILK